MRNSDALELGDRVPRRGNAFSRAVSGALLRLFGWRFEGSVPDVGKAVYIVAPHTSNWDFFVGVTAMFAIGFRTEFLGKHTLFSGPLGVLMRWLGGIPVDRRSSAGVVDETVRLFDSRDQMLLGLSPEGTRGNVHRWKTGFYFIAQKAGVPIIPVSFDYRERVIRIGGAFVPTGDLQGNLAELAVFFSGVAGRKGE